MKQRLIDEHSAMVDKYRGYFSTEVFSKERHRLFRIKRILFFRYKINIL